ncbi:MAG TPA: TlpA disulfide reductase family protein [Candidatus Polarisedimenticolaceae bacterium]|nr:TlpA disulfide reductase family protein [Candidatus Polarisedimenticolaceae bacterium]
MLLSPLLLGIQLAAAAPALRPADAAELLHQVRRSGARAVLLNVWATWCQPCREELPDLLRLRRELGGRGLAVMLVSADFEDEGAAAARFLGSQGVDFPTWLKSGRDAPFIDGLAPAWSGALPASFVFDGTGKLHAFREGKQTYETFRELVLDVLERSGQRP